MSGHRFGRRQLEQLRDQLTQRDTEILETVRAFRLLSGDQLRRIHFTNHSTPATASRVARRILGKLSGLGLLHRHERRIGGIRAGSAGYIYSLSPLGHRLLGTPTRKRSSEPTAAFTRHTLAIAELAVQLIETDTTGNIELLSLQPEPAAWRNFPNGAVTQTLKPDLHVQLATGDYELSWFIEIDCATESTPTIQRKCQTYLDYQRTGIEQRRHGIFPRVLWVTPDQNRAEQLRRAIEDERLPPQLFLITTNGQAVRRLIDTEAKP